MNPIKACTYRYFTSGLHPRRSLGARLVLGVVGLMALGGLVHQTTPKALFVLLPTGSGGQAAFAFLLTGGFTAVLFALTHVAYRNYLARAEVVYYLAISPLRAKLLRAYMYVPLAAAGLGLGMVLGLKLAALPVAAVLIICLLGTLSTAVAQACLRGAGYTALAQVLAFGQASLGLLIAGQALAGKQTHLSLGAWLLLGVTALCLALAWRLPIRWLDASQQKRGVIPFRHLGLVSLSPATALRNTRFVHALIAWAGMSFVLLMVAWLSPAALPFDAAAMGSLLLAGALGQEVRSLWGRWYPVPLVLYRDVFRWHMGNWLVGGTICTAAAALVLLVGIAYFPGVLSVGTGYVVCFALCLGASGLFAGTVLVPERTDIVSQIGSAILYLGFAWGVVRLLAMADVAGEDAVIVATTGVCACGFGVGWILEQLRWSRITKGTYANIFQN